MIKIELNLAKLNSCNIQGLKLKIKQQVQDDNDNEQR